MAILVHHSDTVFPRVDSRPDAHGTVQGNLMVQVFVNGHLTKDRSLASPGQSPRRQESWVRR